MADETTEELDSQSILDTRLAADRTVLKIILSIVIGEIAKTKGNSENAKQYVQSFKDAVRKIVDAPFEQQDSLSEEYQKQQIKSVNQIFDSIIIGPNQ